MPRGPSFGPRPRCARCCTNIKAVPALVGDHIPEIFFLHLQFCTFAEARVRTFHLNDIKMRPPVFPCHWDLHSSVPWLCGDDQNVSTVFHSIAVINEMKKGSRNNHESKLHPNSTHVQLFLAGRSERVSEVKPCMSLSISSWDGAEGPRKWLL